MGKLYTVKGGKISGVAWAENNLGEWLFDIEFSSIELYENYTNTVLSRLKIGDESPEALYWDGIMSEEELFKEFEKHKIINKIKKCMENI